MSEENDARLEELFGTMPRADDISVVTDDIRQWFARQNVQLTPEIEYGITMQVHEAGAAMPWLVRAHDDITRIAKSKPVQNVKEEKATSDRFSILIFILLVCIAAASFMPIMKVFLVAGPIGAICLWFLIRQVRTK